MSVARNAKSLWQRRFASDRLLIAFTVIAVGVSQVIFNLVLNNPEHFPTSGLFFIYVIAAILLLPMLVVAGIDSAVFRLFGDRWQPRMWRTLLYLFVFASVVRQAQLLTVEPIDSWARDLAGTTPLLWVVLGVALLAWFWYGSRLLNTFFLYLSPLALTLLGIFTFQAGLLGSAWTGDEAGGAGESISVPSSKSGNHPPIFIIMWDELEYDEVIKDGHFDADLVPNFARLADDSIWFTNAKTLSPVTEISILTFLTGTLLESPKSATSPTIFDLLAGDYDLHIYEEKAVLARQFGCVNPAVTCSGALYNRSRFPLAAGKWAISQYLDLIVPIKIFETIGYVPSVYEPQIKPILEDIEKTTGFGNLWYWHVILPHTPYVFNPDGTKHGPSGDKMENYRKQTQYVDLLLGRFVSALKANGLYDEAIFVVTTDHGKQSNCPCPIPMIIRAPGISAEYSDVNYTHLDFVPTLLYLLDIPNDPGHGLAGKSAFSP